MEGLFSLLGLPSNLDDPKKFQISQEDKNSMVRSQALGEALGMMLPMGVAGKAAQRAKQAASVIEGAPEWARGALRTISSRFPRTFSSVESVTTLPRSHTAAGGMQSNAFAREGQFANLALDPNLEGQSLEQVETLGHEMAHVAQALRRAKPGAVDVVGSGVSDMRRFDKDYDKLEDIFGYGANPLERSARVTGLNQANRQMMRERAAEGPLLPGIASNKNIKEWSKAMADQPGKVESIKASGATRLKEKFGASPSGQQPRLPLEGAAAVEAGLPSSFRREYRLNEEVVPKPNFKAPDFPTAERMNANARPPVYSNPFADGNTLDISNLAKTMGVNSSGAQKNVPSIKLVLGERPKVQIQQFDARGKARELVEYEVPQGMADLLRQRSFDLDRGVETTARGVKRKAGTQKKEE